MEQTIQILLIEDDMDDVELLEGSLANNNVPYNIRLINDGGDVSEYLRENKEYPHVIVMDFNLPKVHGKELLRDIKASPFYRDIPLLVLTTSSAREDVQYSMRMGADKFMIKPSSSEELNDIAGVISELAAL
jgi:response regulator RpfG family c-di-GMP phosphodiesterase